MTCAYPVTKLVQTFGDMLRRLRTEAALTQGELAKQTNEIHRTASVDADFPDPDLIISDARNVLNLGKPVAVMFMGVLGYVADVSGGGGATSSHGSNPTSV